MKGLNSRRIGLWCLALGMTLGTGCSGGRSSPTEPSPTIDSVALETISPPTGNSLAAGSRVEFRGRVRYTLASASAGVVALVIQDQAGRSLNGPQPNVSVSRGGGTVELTSTIQLPVSGVSSVDVIFPLFPSGARESAAAVSVSYSVR
jgi:hypothetical protein